MTGLYHDAGESTTIQGLESEECGEGWELDFVFDRFRIHHVARLPNYGGFRTMTFNENDTLYFETESAAHAAPHLYGST